MKLLLLILCTYTLSYCLDSLPDRSLTPGAVSNESHCNMTYQTIPSMDIAVKVCERYKIKYDPKTIYIDYLIPLSLGGKDTITNMWPMSKGYYLKKRIFEKKLYRMVCSGMIFLSSAQYRLKTDWLYGYYNF